MDRGSKMSRTRVLLADDHTLLLEAFQKLLEPEFEVVGTVADGRALVAAASRLKPDVVVLDIAMPLLNGLDAAQQIMENSPGIKVIFLTMNPDPDFATEALNLGASGYLLKTSASSELTKTIREALCGKKYVTSHIARELEKAFIANPTGKKLRRELSPRQREVLQLLAEGQAMKEVASILNISQRTVAYHKYKMMEDLRLKTTAELIQYAVKNRVVPY
jgi:DNA-binding NarL/FixJ family response regulator